MISRSSWYAQGLRWLASLFKREAEPLDPSGDHQPQDEFLSDVRHRILSRYY